jgi:hypothetical protein
MQMRAEDLFEKANLSIFGAKENAFQPRDRSTRNERDDGDIR